MGPGHDPTRRRVLELATAVVVGAVTGFNADTVIHEQSALGVTQQAVDLPAWPAAMDGLTVGFLTDLHRSGTVSRELVDRAVAELLSLRPGLIVLGGDYVSFGERAYVDSVAESLARLRAPHGVFAVLGNHDDERFVPAALARVGIEVLRDERTRITVAGHALDLVGVRYWTRRVAEIAAMVDPQAAGAHPARARPAAPARGGGPGVSPRAVGAHPRRPGRAPGSGRGGPQVPHRVWAAGPRPHAVIRQPRHRDGVCPGALQVPARSGAGHTPAKRSPATPAESRIGASMNAATNRRPSTTPSRLKNQGDGAGIHPVLLDEDARREQRPRCRRRARARRPEPRWDPASRSALTKWHRGAADLDAVQQGLPLRVQPGERGQQRRVDVEDGVWGTRR